MPCEKPCSGPFPELDLVSMLWDTNQLPIDHEPQALFSTTGVSNHATTSKKIDIIDTKSERSSEFRSLVPIW